MKKLFILPLIVLSLAFNSCSSSNPHLTRLHQVVNDCKAEEFFQDNQLIFDIDTSTIDATSTVEFLKLDCAASALMSKATYAQFGNTTALSGLQEVTENGFLFKFSYNGSSNSLFLSIQLVS